MGRPEPPDADGPDPVAECCGDSAAGAMPEGEPEDCPCSSVEETSPAVAGQDSVGKQELSDKVPLLPALSFDSEDLEL
jgi:hypothetical protein